MKYDPMEVELKGNGIVFYFIGDEFERPFYDIYDVRNEKDIKKWDEHLSKKMWYTPDIRKRALELMGKLVKK